MCLEQRLHFAPEGDVLGTCLAHEVDPLARWLRKRGMKDLLHSPPPTSLIGHRRAPCPSSVVDITRLVPTATLVSPWRATGRALRQPLLPKGHRSTSVPRSGLDARRAARARAVH